MKLLKIVYLLDITTYGNNKNQDMQWAFVVRRFIKKKKILVSIFNWINNVYFFVHPWNWLILKIIKRKKSFNRNYKKSNL